MLEQKADRLMQWRFKSPLDRKLILGVIQRNPLLVSETKNFEDSAAYDDTQNFGSNSHIIEKESDEVYRVPPRRGYRSNDGLNNTAINATGSQGEDYWTNLPDQNE